MSSKGKNEYKRVDKIEKCQQSLLDIYFANPTNMESTVLFIEPVEKPSDVSIEEHKEKIIKILEKKPFLLFNSKNRKNRVYTKCDRCLTLQERQERARPMAPYFNILTTEDVNACRPNFVRVLETFNVRPENVCSHRLQTSFQQLNAHVVSMQKKIQGMIKSYELAGRFQHDQLCLTLAGAHASAARTEKEVQIARAEVHRASEEAKKELDEKKLTLERVNWLREERNRREQRMRMELERHVEMERRAWEGVTTTASNDDDEEEVHNPAPGGNPAPEEGEPDW